MMPLFVCSAVFWSLYQQQFTVVTIYADERLDRNLFGWEMPISWVQSINPVFIIVLAGVFALAVDPARRPRAVDAGEVRSATVADGLRVLPVPGDAVGAHSVPLIGLAMILLVFTVAELLISPVGLSVSTKLAPAKYHTQMVALFFLSIALGTAMSGKLAGYYDSTNETPFFLWIGGAAVLTGVVVLLANRPIRRLMSGVH